MMKNKAGLQILTRAALAAALFIGGCAAGNSEIARELTEKPALKAADERGQRLFDQAVKLHRRYAGTKPLKEPFKSILTEISLYHEEDLATYLSDVGSEGKRSEAIEAAPWATARLAKLNEELGDFEAAAEAWHDLKERFAGRMVVEPSDINLYKEKAEPLGIRGEIQAFLSIARLGNAKSLSDVLEPRIGLLQANFGREESPCHLSPCPTYSHLALEALWDSLSIQKADFKAWRKATQNFAKRENSPEFKAYIYKILGFGEISLGKKEEGMEDQSKAGLSPVPAVQPYPPLKGLFANLIK